MQIASCDKETLCEAAMKDYFGNHRFRLGVCAQRYQ
jgi:hypothetical protein